MKKILLTVLMMTSLGARAAQSDDMAVSVAPSKRAGSWTLMPQLGVTSFSIKGSDISGSRSGGQIGALVDYQSDTPELQWETGLQYTQAGAKDDAILASVEYELNYLTVPLGVRYRLSGEEAGLSHWYARAGVTLGYLMSAKSKAQVLGFGAEEDIKSQTNTMDVLPYVGVGTTWAMAADQFLGFDFNYTRGLTKVFKDQASTNEGWIINGVYAFLF